MSKTQQSKGPERKDYTLKAAHTHRGRDYAAGEHIQLTANQAEFLKGKLDLTQTQAAAVEAPAAQES